MNPPNETPAKAPNPPDLGEVVALLKQIVELLDEIDGSLANIGGSLDAIYSKMP
jgi:hypothetical protein